MLSQSYSVTLICDMFGCARGGYYHQGKQPDETELKAVIEAAAAEWPTYGYHLAAGAGPSEALGLGRK